MRRSDSLHNLAIVHLDGNVTLLNRDNPHMHEVHKELQGHPHSSKIKDILKRLHRRDAKPDLEQGSRR